MINSSERRALRARAHPLKPVVLLGQHGLTPAVFVAIDEALTAHELIKIRLRGVERETRESVVTDIATQTNAEVINLIGHILTLYRAKPAPVAASPPAPPRKKRIARPARVSRAAPPARASARDARDPRRPPARGGNPRRGPGQSPTRRGPK